jgi:hypothetical protein
LKISQISQTRKSRISSLFCRLENYPCVLIVKIWPQLEIVVFYLIKWSNRPK